MTKELCLDNGIEEAIKIITKVDEKPVLVAIYGWPDSGKSYLIDKIVGHFEKEALEVARYGGAPRPSTFEHIKARPNVLKNIFLFHCGWQRYIRTKEGYQEYILKNEDPNYLTKTILKRDIDLDICIYNPNFRKKPIGEYNLIISNPDSRVKNY